MKIVSFEAGEVRYRSIEDAEKRSFDSASASVLSKENCWILVEVEDHEKRISRGIIAKLSIEEYRNNKLLRHERTLAKKEQKSIQKLLDRKFASKPILSFFNPNDDIQDLIREAFNDCEFITTSMDIKYRSRYDFYVLTNEKIGRKLGKALKNLPYLFLGDGHHRMFASDQLYGAKDGFKKEKYVMTAFFDLREIHIGSFHRLLKEPSDLDKKIQLLEKANLITRKVVKWDDQIKKPSKKGSFWVYYRDILEEWTWKDKPLKGIDTKRIDEDILRDTWGFDLRSNGKVEYLDDRWSMHELKQKCDDVNGLLIMPTPTDISKVVDISLENKVMPPKSTWFLPRMISNVILMKLKS